MRKKKTIVIVIILLIALNIISSYFYTRLDITKDKRFTLSQITTNLATKVDAPLSINVYLEGDFPAEFKRLQTETAQFLEELNAINRNINVTFINPSNIKETLIKKGIMPSQLTVEEDGKLSEAIIFPWAELQYKNKTERVSLLPDAIVASPEKQLEKAIENLEFSFTSALQTITTTQRKKVGVLSGNGQLDDVYQFSYLSKVKNKYRLAKITLDSVSKAPQKTLDNLNKLDLIIIAKPTEAFTEKEKLVVDQFITNGGKTLWMLDNTQAEQDSLAKTGNMLAYPIDLNLTDLLFSYGVRINTTLIKDLYAAKIPVATGKIGNQTQFKNLDWFYHPLAGGNKNHVITKNILPVRLQFANQIDTLKNNIKKTPLLVSSSLTNKVGIPKIIALKDISAPVLEENYNNGFQLFAVLLEGNFKSAYKNRVKPYPLKNIKDNATNNKMIVIADGDVGKNQILKGKPYDLSRDKWTNEQFGNKDFILNSIDYLLDDTGLTTLRTKNLTLANLDKQKAFKERLYWQLINCIVPLVLLAIFGIGFNYFRRLKYK